MRANSIGAGAGWGLLAGALVGVVEATVARGGTLSGPWAVFGWATAADGMCGLLLGALAGALVTLPAARWPAMVGGLTVAAGLGAARLDPARPTLPAAERDKAPDVYWFLVDELSLKDADPRLPRLAALREQSIRFTNAWVPDVDAARALATLLAPDPAPAIGLAEAFGWLGYATGIVLRGDAPSLAEVGEGFDAVAPVAGEHPWHLDAATRRLWWVRAFGPAAAPPDAALVGAATARLLDHRSGGAAFVVAQLGAATFEELEATLLVLDPPPEALVLVTNTGARAWAGGDPLGPAASRTEAWLRVPSDPRAGRALVEDVSTVQLAATLFEEAAQLHAPVWTTPLLDSVWRQRSRTLKDEVQDDRVGGYACLIGHGRLGGYAPQTRHETDRVVRTVTRVDGFALVDSRASDGTTSRALFDELADPFWAVDLLTDREVCGLPVAGRVQAIEALREELAQVTPQPLPEHPPLPFDPEIFPPVPR